MTFSPALRFSALLLTLLILLSCGETFRPVATPLIPSPTSPAATHLVLMLSRNGPNNPGASSDIDVSGNTIIGVAPMGLGPVHAVMVPNASRMYVANSLEDTVSSFSPSSISPIVTTSLPTGSTPVFVATTENATVYVANFAGNTVGVIPTSTNVLLDPLIPVGVKPVALAETPDQGKLYSANSGDGTVTSIDIAGRVPIAAIPTGNSPVWIVARPDSVLTPPAGFRIYVLNSGSGTVSDIDSATDTVLGSVPVGAGANFMVYDKTRTRLYVVNPASKNVVVLDASTDPPTQVTPSIDLTQAPSGAPLCAGVCHPVSITVLPNGSRAYVVSYAVVSPAIEWQVSVVNLLNNTIRTLAPLDPSQTLVNIDTVNPTGCGASPFGASPLPFRFSLVAAADSSQVYVASCDSGGVAIIRTSDDTLLNDTTTPGLFTLFAPPSVFQSPTISITAASQSGSNTIYTYTPVSGPLLRLGEDIVVTGMQDSANNGNFIISALAAGTFTVVNPSGLSTTSAQQGTGAVAIPPPQNPAFMLAGP